MEITLMDTRTGETVTVDENEVVSPYVWAEGNWSCDCNRVRYFSDAVQMEHAKEMREYVCDGAKRFLVVAPPVFEDEDHRYTLREINGDYPEELLDRFIPLS